MPGNRTKVNPALVRRWNVARVFHALRDADVASHGELVAATGLDPATVTAVLRQLRADGWVRVADREPPSEPVPGGAPGGRAGRPPVRLVLDDAAGVLVGARLEPGTVRLVATTLGGRPRAAWQGAAATDPAGAVRSLEDGVDALLAEIDAPRTAVRALGVGVPALVARDGRVVFGPNLGWRDVPLRAELALRWSVPVVVDNDTKAAALAERLFGAARGARDFVLVAGHSGIGGAVHLDGRLVRGSGGFAGELGHVTVEPGGRPCACGDRGCLEAYLAEHAIEAQLRERGVAVRGYEGAAARAAAGDEVALAVLDEVGGRLGRALADVVDLLDPERIVLAGSLALVAPHLMAAVERALAAPALARHRGRCRVVVSPLGPDAVPMGGAALAMDVLVAAPDAWTPPAAVWAGSAGAEGRRGATG
jgi:predicted NBD/HSP70 family sugar kinase